MFGSHLFISGGMHNALLEAERLEMNCVQVFTKNQQQWKVKPLEEDLIANWKSHCTRLNFAHTVRRWFTCRSAASNWWTPMASPITRSTTAKSGCRGGSSSTWCTSAWRIRLR